MYFDNNMMGAAIPAMQRMQRQQPMTGTSPVQSQQVFTGAPTGGGGALGGLAPNAAQRNMQTPDPRRLAAMLGAMRPMR